jgi:hypothetical protein
MNTQKKKQKNKKNKKKTYNMGKATLLSPNLLELLSPYLLE